MADEELSLSDLARITGTERRTIRSYIAEGLLRGPDTVGRNASYGRHHLDRLRAIRVLRDQDRLGLPEIRRQFLTLGDQDIAAIAERSEGAGVAVSSEEPTSALDYIRALRARLKAEPDIAAGEASAGDNVAGVMTPPRGSILRKDAQPMMRLDDDAQPMMRLARRAWSLSETPSLMEVASAPSELGGPYRHQAELVQQIEKLHHAVRDLHNQTADSRARERDLREQSVQQIAGLRHAIRELHEQTADFRARERDLREQLAISQSELAASRRSQAVAMGPSTLATDPGAPRMETFVRIAVLPDVEILVRGAPDDERLKLIQEHAEHLQKALLQEGKHEC